MTELLQWLSGDPAKASFVAGVIAFLLLGARLLYVVAVCQGRSVSFWPPKIGRRPPKHRDEFHPSSVSKQHRDVSGETQGTDNALPSIPVQSRQRAVPLRGQVDTSQIVVK